MPASARTLALIAALAAIATAARSDGIGNKMIWADQATFGGIGGVKATAACTSTGIYDLSNVCNDIYFIGALK